MKAVGRRSPNARLAEESTQHTIPRPDPVELTTDQIPVWQRIYNILEIKDKSHRCQHSLTEVLFRRNGSEWDEIEADDVCDIAAESGT